MSIPPRRDRLPQAQIFSRSVIVSLVALVGLLISLIILRKKTLTPESIPTDTLEVKTQGLFLNRKETSIDELWSSYSKEQKPHRVDVVFDPELPWGKTWALRDTLKKLVLLNPRLKINGLEGGEDW